MACAALARPRDFATFPISLNFFEQLFDAIGQILGALWLSYHILVKQI